jgi:hypothetical protein
VRLELLSAAGSSPNADGQAGEGAGGVAGGRGTAGGDARAGTGGMPRVPPYPCDNQWEPDQEEALSEALSEAFDSGRYCPHTPPPQRRPLAVDSDLQWQAHAAVCFAFTDRGWVRLSRNPPVFAWALVNTPNLEDAKKALLGAEHQEICDESQRMAFRRVGVGHSSETWSVIIGSAFPEDMQKP